MVKKEEAKKFLSEVSGDRYFMVNNGPVLKSLNDLGSLMPNMSDDTFKYHVNKEKNDFSNWISDSVGDKELAMDIAKSKNKASFTSKLNKRLESLKKADKGWF